MMTSLPYVPLLLLCGYTVACTVCSALPSTCAGITLGLNVFVLVGLFWSYQKKLGGGEGAFSPSPGTVFTKPCLL